MYEDLCRATGEKRLEIINSLKLWELDYICEHVKECSKCPLALHYVDQYRVPRLCCTLISGKFRVKNLLVLGGEFKEVKHL